MTLTIISPGSAKHRHDGLAAADDRRRGSDRRDTHDNDRARLWRVGFLRLRRHDVVIICRYFFGDREYSFRSLHLFAAPSANVTRGLRRAVVKHRQRAPGESGVEGGARQLVARHATNSGATPIRVASSS